MSALREWMAEVGERGQIAVSWLGKVKTASQMMAIAFCLAFPIKVNFTNPGLWILALSAILTLWSMWLYLKVAWPHIFK